MQNNEVHKLSEGILFIAHQLEKEICLVIDVDLNKT